MSDDSISHLFVYGTLQPGDVRWPFLAPYVADEGVPDTVCGRVYDTGRGYPAARFDEPGVYRINAVAQRGETQIAAANRWILVGGADLEMADPRLNDEVLRRIATASGGSYLGADDIGDLPSLIAAAAAEPASPQVEELWHNVWIFVVLMLLLAAEWVLRRRWGLR